MQCPHCLKHFHENWSYQVLAEDSFGGPPFCWVIGTTICAACKHLIAQLYQQQVVRSPQGGLIATPHNIVPVRLMHPAAISRAPVSSDVPEEFASDYKEACAVLPHSEKASAALSRRSLQHLLREKGGFTKRDLADQIQEALDSKQLPSHLAGDLDAVRNIGNFAAHPSKSKSTGEIVEVEPHEAEWSLNLLEGLFDFYFVQPAQAKAKRDALNAKLQALGKPPMKTP